MKCINCGKELKDDEFEMCKECMDIFASNIISNEYTKPEGF